MISTFRQNLPIKQKMQVVVCLQAAFLLGVIAVPFVVASFPVRDDAVTAVVLGVQAGLVAVAVGVGMVLSRAVVRPYVTTVVRMEAMVAGDLDSPIQFTDYRDCVGRLTKAMHHFQQAAKAKMAAESEAQSLRDSTENDRAQREAVQAEAAEQQQAVVQGLAAGLSSLAGGNLTFELTDVFAPEYERLRTDFNRTVEQLRATMVTIITNTNAIRSGTSEIAQASDDLSRRTEQQAASLEQTAAALDEITNTVRRTAEGSKQAKVIVTAARADAEHSGLVVGNAVVAMGEIEKSSQQISQIIGVIDEIAFQTNLLALNAGVEAARAGDAGRGFAVVASEVRALAQRSAEAAKEIKGLIALSRKHVTEGVKLVGDTGQALTRIVAQVAEIDGTVVAIASSAEEQATGLQEVNVAVNQMDQVTQQNAAMVEQSTAATHTLSREAEELSQLTARFQVTGGDARQAGSEVIQLRPASGGPVRRPAAPKPVAAAAMRTSAVRKVAVEAASDDWQEF